MAARNIAGTGDRGAAAEATARGEGDADAAPPEEEDTNGRRGRADVDRAARGERDADTARIAADGLVCLGAGDRATVQLDTGTGSCAAASEETATPQREEEDVLVIINSAVHRSTTPNHVACNLDLDKDDKTEEEQLRVYLFILRPVFVTSFLCRIIPRVCP